MGFLNNFFGGGAKPQFAYQPQESLLAPMPITEMQKVGIYGDLVNAKQGYDDATKAIGLIQQNLQTPDLSEAARNSFQRRLDVTSKLRDAYAQSADSTRKTAAAMGLDVSDYGSDKTLAEANQAFQDYRNVSMKNFLNLPTLRELEENRYKELRSNGASPRQAERIIGRERGDMQDKLARHYRDAFLTYGVNADRSIDPIIGMNLLGGLAKVDPVTATMYYNGFAQPQKVYDANQQLSIAGLNNSEAMARLVAQNNANWQNSEAQRQSTRSNLEYTVGAQSKENTLNRESQFKLKALDYLFGGRGGSGNSGNKIASEIDELYQSMLPKDADENTQKEVWNKATTMVFDRYYKGWNELPNAKLQDALETYDALRRFGVSDNAAKTAVAQKLGFTEPKEETPLEKAGKLFSNSFDQIQETILSGNKDSATEQIEDLRTLLDSKDYKELLDQKRYNLISKTLDMYTKLANGEYETDAGKTQYIKDRYFIENDGVEATPDEIQRIMKEGKYFGVPTRAKVETPKWKFEPPPLAPTSPYSWANNSNVQSSAYVPYGQGAIFFNK